MIWEAFKLSALVVTVATLIIATVGLSLGLLFAKAEFPGREVLASFFTLPLVLPPTVTGFFLIVLFGRHGLIGAPVYNLTGWSVAFTWQAAVIAAVVLALPLMVLSSRAAIESVNPQYEIASYTLGKSPLATFLRITLPLARRGILAGIVLSFTRALGEFGATFMLAGNIPGKTQTMPLAIYEAVISGDNKQAQALALILTGVSVVAVYFTSKLSKGVLRY
ncbi:MAG TPA: molybdate ABC transporter permease subunit [Pyrinomonadaceae bacterium]|nr:molybdate ABC transporter permease subunit [Pyrinomonadaceae bacterium]